ncbi:MAG: hypothetical protein U0Q16_04410 [Bryobacteraceae bacterium]
MPRLLQEMYRLQAEPTGFNEEERRLLKMFANILESHYEVEERRNLLTVEEYLLLPGRWELLEGVLY